MFERGLSACVHFQTKTEQCKSTIRGPEVYTHCFKWDKGIQWSGRIRRISGDRSSSAPDIFFFLISVRKPYGNAENFRSHAQRKREHQRKAATYLDHKRFSVDQELPVIIYDWGRARNGDDTWCCVIRREVET